MNFENINAVRISDILENLHFHPISFAGKYTLYFSPFQEKQPLPTFRLDTYENQWHDEVINAGGNCVEFACLYLKYQGEDHTLYDAARWVENISRKKVHFKDKSAEAVQSSYALRSIDKLEDESLLDYMAELAIPATTAQKYLRQVTIYSQQDNRRFIALGVPNEDEGCQFFNSTVSGVIGVPDVSVIRGLQPKAESMNVFFDIKDFLAVVAREPGQVFKCDSLILHSYALLHKVPPYLYQYKLKALYSWMENDPEGTEAKKVLSDFCAVEPGVKHLPQNNLYLQHQNVGEFYRHQRQLAL